MAGEWILRAFSGKALDQFSVATDEASRVVPAFGETQAEPAGFSGEISEVFKDAQFVGVGECADRAGGEAITGFGPVTLPPEAPPGFELWSDGFSKGWQGGRGLGCGCTALQGACGGGGGVSSRRSGLRRLPGARSGLWRGIRWQ